MRTSFQPGNAPELTQADRDQMFQALPASGKDAQGAFALWAFGVPGVKREAVDGVIADPRVQSELREQEIDPQYLLHAIEDAAVSLGAWKIHDALQQPMERLLLMSAMRS